MTLNITQKGLVLVALPLLFQLGVVLLVVLFQSETTTAERLATHTKEVIAQGHEIHSLVADAQSAIRGYVLTRDPSFATPLHHSGTVLPNKLDELETLVLDNPQQSVKAVEVRQAAMAVLNWQQGTESLVQGDGPTAVARVSSGDGERLSDTFRQRISEFLSEEDRLDRDRVTTLEQARSRLNLLLVVGGVLAVGTTLAVGFAFHRGIVGRFAAVEETARQLAAGSTTAPPLTGRDEAARLDVAFRDMAAGLSPRSAPLRHL